MREPLNLYSEAGSNKRSIAQMKLTQVITSLLNHPGSYRCISPAPPITVGQVKALKQKNCRIYLKDEAGWYYNDVYDDDGMPKLIKKYLQDDSWISNVISIGGN